MRYRKKKQYDDDDGRVIAPMNVDGMPWYDPSKKYESGNGAPIKENEDRKEDDELEYASLTEEEKKEYRKETRAIIAGILKRFMPIVIGGVAIFGLVIFIFWLIWK